MEIRCIMIDFVKKGHLHCVNRAPEIHVYMYINMNQQVLLYFKFVAWFNKMGTVEIPYDKIQSIAHEGLSNRKVNQGWAKHY